jgi:hypothetical protein
MRVPGRKQDNGLIQLPQRYGFSLPSIHANDDNGVLLVAKPNTVLQTFR